MDVKFYEHCVNSVFIFWNFEVFNCIWEKQIWNPFFSICELTSSTPIMVIFSDDFALLERRGFLRGVNLSKVPTDIFQDFV